MKTKRKARTRKQRGGSDAEIVAKLDMLGTITEFRTLAKTFHEVYPDEKKLNRQKWISILKQLFQKNGIKLTFHDHRDEEVSTAVLSYYETEAKQSPVQRLEQYLNFAYENLRGIVKNKIDNSQPLRFSVIRDEVLEITKGIRPGNADFVVLPHQWVYLLIRLYNRAHSSVILDSGLPLEIKRQLTEYYEKMDRGPNYHKMAEEESRSREEALRMAPPRVHANELRVPVTAEPQYFLDQSNPNNR